MDRCPDTEVLGRVLAGSLLEPEGTVVIAHVGSCPRCQDALEQLSDDPELRRWKAAAAQTLYGSSSNPWVGRVVAALRTAGSGIPELSYAFLGPPDQPGDLGSLGTYRVLDELGRGGMGIVLRGHDAALDRAVAIKVLRPDLASGPTRDRLLHEAQAAARFKHDHVVSVYAVAMTPDGLPYIVMEYLAGPTLAQRITASPALGLREAAELAAQVADGLAAAHQAGLVHRDVKPSNIMLDPATGRAKLLDFGLARLAERCSGLTQEGLVAGTPVYMSPEQARGQPRLDGRTDVYSLGMTLYEALTGEVPFRGKPHLVLQQVLADEPRPPRQLNDSVPRDLETICLKAMAKEPARRYQTAADLALELRRFLRGEPIVARPVGRVERWWRWCRRNPRVATLSAALLLSLFGGLAAVTWQWRRAQAEFQRAETQLERGRVEHARAEAGYQQARAAVDKYFLTVSADPALAKPGLLTLRKQLLEEAGRYYEDFLRQHAEDDSLLPELAKAARNIGLIAGFLGRWPEAAAAHRQAAGLWERVAQADSTAAEPQTNLAIAYSELASAESFTGKVQEPLSRLDQARAIWERLVDQHPADARYRNYLAKNCNHIGAALCAIAGKIPQAIELQRRALGLWEKLVDEKPADPLYQHDLARVCLELGGLYEVIGKPADSLPLYQRARAIWEKRRAEGMRTGMGCELGYCYEALGELQSAAGHTAEALQLFESARADLEPLARGDPDQPHLTLALAEAYRRIGELQQCSARPAVALASLQQACALLEGVLKAAPNVHRYQGAYGGALDSLAQTLAEQGQLEQARDTFSRAVAQHRAALASAPEALGPRVELSRHFRGLARVERSLGHPEQAAAATLERAKLWPADREELYQAACELALCVPLAGPSPEKRLRYEEPTLETLRQAIRQGFQDGQRLDKEAALAPLRALPAFQKLRAEITAAPPGSGR
jgi:eukaryotic-like serine/threonine-protein kinase